jgi:hypothetical protein
LDAAGGQPQGVHHGGGHGPTVGGGAWVGQLGAAAD